MFPQHILVYERVISMFNTAILCVPRSEAIRHAGNYLSEAGLQVSPKPAPDISHVLLPIPSFPTGDEYLAHILSDLPDDVIISGGNLSSPLLKNYTAVDFLHIPVLEVQQILSAHIVTDFVHGLYLLDFIDSA